MIDWSHSTKNERETIRAALSYYDAAMKRDARGKRHIATPRSKSWHMFTIDELLDSMRGR